VWFLAFGYFISGDGRLPAALEPTFLKGPFMEMFCSPALYTGTPHAEGRSFHFPPHYFDYFLFR
jgi:hypothetical protein